MAAEYSLHTIKTARLNHSVSPSVSFLVWLKDECYRAAEFFPPRLQYHGRAQCSRNVNVMAASVHHSGIFADEITARCLSYWESVNVGTYSAIPPGQFPVNPSDYSCVYDSPVSDPSFVEVFLDEFSRVKFVVSDFRGAVKLLANLC